MMSLLKRVQRVRTSFPVKTQQKAPTATKLINILVNKSLSQPCQYLHDKYLLNKLRNANEITI